MRDVISHVLVGTVAGTEAQLIGTAVTELDLWSDCNVRNVSVGVKLLRKLNRENTKENG